MTERDDSGRQAQPVVFLDETEHPQTLHEVAQIMLSCQDRALDSDEITSESPIDIELSTLKQAAIDAAEGASNDEEIRALWEYAEALEDRLVKELQ